MIVTGRTLMQPLYRLSSAFPRIFDDARIFVSYKTIFVDEF
jgi:hypothetical protein